MPFLGESISLLVAFLWTVTALAADGASHRVGSLPVNILRMLLSLVLLSATMWIFSGSPYPLYADARVWMWLCLSGLVGYVFGDFCLFNCYLVIGSRFGQLFMTTAPLFAALTGWMFLGEMLTARQLLAVLITIFGIGMTILTKGSAPGRLAFKLPVKGILLGLGAGLGQGVGLVLSKVGMNAYAECIPTDAPASFESVMPFASTFIRAVIGACGFLAMALIQKSFGQVRAAVHDRRAMGLVALTTFMGPFLGVSLSLMAVRYTSAGVASTLMALVPAIIILPHALIYHQKVTFREVAGTLISLVGVAMFF